MFSMAPVDRSSRQYTSSPRCKCLSARCEPMKPAPPVIKTFISFSLFSSYWSRRYFQGGSAGVQELMIEGFNVADQPPPRQSGSDVQSAPRAHFGSGAGPCDQIIDCFGDAI